MQNELVHSGIGEDPKRARKKINEAGVEKRPQDEILGGCSLENLWESKDEMEENMRALSVKTKRMLFDQEEGKEEISDSIGGLRVVSRFDVFEKAFRRFTPEDQAKEWVKEVIKEGKGQAVRALANALGDHLKKGTMLKQWKGKISRGDSREDIRDEIKNVMKKFWEEGTAPVLSVAEIHSRREQYKVEIQRLEKERNRLEGILHQVAKPLLDRKAAEHKKRKAEEEWQKMYSFFGSRNADDWNKETHKTGYITGFQRMIEMNEKELRELDRMESGALSIEVLFARLKPMLNDSDLANLWGDVMDFVDPITQEVYFGALMRWLDEVGEIVPQEGEIQLDKKTQMLLGRFREAYRLVNHPVEGADPVANIRHVQLILRSIVRLLSRASQQPMSQVS